MSMTMTTSSKSEEDQKGLAVIHDSIIINRDLLWEVNQKVGIDPEPLLVGNESDFLLARYTQLLN